MTVTFKDAATTPQAFATLPTSAGELAVVHTQAAAVNGVATPISNASPMPVMLTSGLVASDGSGTIAAGGVAQNLFSGTVPTNGYWVFNHNALLGRTLYISDVGVASAGGTSVGVAPQSEWRTPPGYKPAATVSIFGTDTGDVFAARRW
jgi:hypothetical protein